jgi:hypothetical protein
MLLDYFRAGFPAVALETVEEQRAVTKITTALKKSYPEILTFSIDGTGTFQAEGTSPKSDVSYAAAFQQVCNMQSSPDDSVILFVKDFHHVAKSPVGYRRLLNHLSEFKAKGVMAVLLAPNWTLPPELAHELPVLEFARPTRDELDSALSVIESTSGKACKNTIRAGLLDAASGLCLQEAENAIALSFVRSGSYERELLEREKMSMINKSGLLEIHPAANPDDIGGLDIIKEFITSEVIPAKDDPKLRVKGILLAGISGTGKSLVSKAAGAWLNWPVIRMDIGRLKGSLVGQSEANMRECLKLITAAAPVVVWCDEVEKALGGHLSSARTDGGTTLGMISQLLVYMQESTAQTFWVATCNDYQLLPTEFTRAGRFDEKFWTDIPTDEERKQIAAIHLRKLGVNGDANKVASYTKDFTGAEIEATIKSTVRRGGNFHDTFKAIALGVKPLAVANAPQVAAFRDWAQDTLKPASRQDVKANPVVRKVSVN